MKWKVITVYHTYLGEKRGSKGDLYQKKRNFQGIKVIDFFFFDIDIPGLKVVFCNNSKENVSI